jgi:uncharacterized membrane protein YobD (UPF0266 family)
MTKFEHIAWYLILLCNVYSLHGNKVGMWIFAALAVVSIFIALIERRSK